MLVAYVVATALVIGSTVAGSLALGVRALGDWSSPRFHHLVQSLTPIAGTGIFLGLSSLTVTLLRVEGFQLGWVPSVRVALLVAASIWSLQLAWLVGKRYSASTTRRCLALVSAGIAVAIADAGWILLFGLW